MLTAYIWGFAMAAAAINIWFSYQRTKEETDLIWRWDGVFGWSMAFLADFAIVLEHLQ